MKTNNKTTTSLTDGLFSVILPRDLRSRTDLLFTLNSPSQWNVLSVYTNIKPSIKPADPVAFDKLWTHLNTRLEKQLSLCSRAAIPTSVCIWRFMGRQDEGVEGEGWDIELCPMGRGRGCYFLLGAYAKLFRDGVINTLQYQMGLLLCCSFSTPHPKAPPPN